MKPTIATLALALAACATDPPIQSQSFVGSGVELRGIPYSLPQAYIEVVLKEDVTKSKLDLVYIPDPNHRYIASVNLNVASGENLSIIANAKGLLTSVTTTSTDASAGITDALVSGVSEIIKARGFEFSQINGPDLPPPEGKNEFLFDPFNIPEDIAHLVKVEPLDASLNRAVQARQKMHRNACPADASICVPLVTPIEVTVRGAVGTQKFVAIVPDPRYAIGLHIDRYACSQTVTTVTLANGVLTDYVINKPSQVAECLSIPLKVIKAILAAPADAIAGRTAGFKARSGELTAQKGLLDAQIALLKAQQNTPE